MWVMYIPARCSGKTKVLEAIKKGRDTMKTIKRRLMNGYVEFSDGTYGKEVAMDRLVQLARDGLDANLTVTEDDTLYIAVHEDEASAFEPSLFFDEEEEEEWASWVKAMREADVMSEYYGMYSDEENSPLLLTSKIENAEDILDNIWEIDQNLYVDCLDSLRIDMTVDMETLLRDMDVVHDPKAKHIFNVYMTVWKNLNYMEDDDV